jgi:hypothetical protein
VIDLDRASLDRVLPAAAGPADWDDVLGRADVRQRRYRRRLVVLVAAALVVAVGTASAIGSLREFFLDKGFIGLPPRGATPSNPESGELVVNFYGRSPTLGGLLSRVWVYADGRMIWHREGEVPQGANKHTSGFLEQRLTPDGVELLRSEVLATALFGHDLTLISPRFRKHDAFWGRVQVRNGNRLIRVDWEDPRIDREKDTGTIATPEQVSALLRVDALVTDAASWLPASAWEIRKIKAYVPSRYAVCLAGKPLIEPSRLIPLIPEPARGLLRAREFAPHEWSGHCSDLTTEEARALREALDAAGVEQFKAVERYGLTYRLEIPGSLQVIAFEPYLPHGEFTCSPCG